MSRWFMQLADKLPVGEERFCPPHRLPHKLPLGSKISDESCHYHKGRLHMLHHRFFCRWMNCPNYEAMMDAAGARAKS